MAKPLVSKTRTGSSSLPTPVYFLIFLQKFPSVKTGINGKKLTPLTCFAKQNMGGNKTGTTGACPVKDKT